MPSPVLEVRGLKKHFAVRRGLFGREGAFVGVTFVELSEHGSIPRRGGGRPDASASTIHLADMSRGLAVGFMSSSVKCDAEAFVSLSGGRQLDARP